MWKRGLMHRATLTTAIEITVLAYTVTARIEGSRLICGAASAMCELELAVADTADIGCWHGAGL